MTPARSFVRSVLSRFHAARLPRPLAEASASAVSASSLTPSVRQTRPRANEQWQHGTSAIFDGFRPKPLRESVNVDVRRLGEAGPLHCGNQASYGLREQLMAGCPFRPRREPLQSSAGPRLERQQIV